MHWSVKHEGKDVEQLPVMQIVKRYAKPKRLLIRLLGKIEKHHNSNSERNCKIGGHLNGLRE